MPHTLPVMLPTWVIRIISHVVPWPGPSLLSAPGALVVTQLSSPLASSLSLSAVAGKTTETGAETCTTTAKPPDPWPAGCPTPAASETRCPPLLGPPAGQTLLTSQDRGGGAGRRGRQEVVVLAEAS